MSETLYFWLHQSQVPMLSALLLGILTAISPCPLATNITAIAYIARNQHLGKGRILLSGLLYTMGLAVSYTGIALIIMLGASKFHVARFFQGNGEKFVGPLMILIGLVMLNVIRLHRFKGFNLSGRWSDTFKDKGMLGTFLLGMLFALAFCPYSGALYFGALVPMSVNSDSGFLYPLFYALGAGTLVMFFTITIAFSASRIGIYFKAIQQAEKIMRILAGLLFVLTGLYYVLIYLKLIA